MRLNSTSVIRVLLLVIILVWLPNCTGFAQPEDSLKRIVRERKDDVSAFIALKKLGGLSAKTNTLKSIAYFRKALTFPFHLEYATDFVAVYNSLGEAYHLIGRYDSSIFMHRKSLSLAQKFNYEKEIGFANQGIGLNFLRMSKPDSAKLFFERALASFKSINNSSLEAGVYINLGNVALDKVNYLEALNQFIKAEKIFLSSETDKAGLCKAVANIGNIECILGNYDKALDYTKRGLDLSINTDNPTSAAYCYRLSGRIYRKKNELQKSLTQYDQALEIYDRLSDRCNASETLQSIGNIYYDLHDYTRALAEYEKSLSVAKSISNNSLEAYAYSGAAYAYYELKKLNEAVTYFDSSATKAKQISNYYLVMDAYEIKSSIDKEKLDFKKALHYHELFSKLKDSLNEQEAKIKANEMEATYQNEKKEIQIKLLQTDQELKSITIKQSRTVQIAMIAALVAVVIAGLTWLGRNRLIQETKRQLEIERMRNNLARDLHDDIGSALSSISIMSQLAGTSSIYATRIL